MLSAVARELDLRVLAPSTDWLSTPAPSGAPHAQLFGLGPSKSNGAGRASQPQFLAYVIGRNATLRVNVSATVEAGASCNAHWIDPSTQKATPGSNFTVASGVAVEIRSAPLQNTDDAALKIECVK